MRLENTMKTMFKSGSFIILASLMACGGGGGSSSTNGGGTPDNPNAATKLVYTDPTPTSTQWVLKKDAASTDTHLILNLMPPSDAVSGFGLGVTINAPSSLAWSKVNSADAQLIHNTAYNLGTGAQLIKAVSKNGDLITGIYQKGLTTTPVAHGAGAVSSIALDLASGAQKTASVSLSVKVSQELQGSGMQTISIATGTIALQ